MNEKFNLLQGYIMLWILLLMCFCDITTGNEDHKISLPAKGKSKLVNRIARRVLEGINNKNVSVQHVSTSDKELNVHSRLVDSAIKDQENENKNYSTNGTRAENAKAIDENKFKMRPDQRTDIHIHPLASANRWHPEDQSVVPINYGSDENFETSYERQKTRPPVFTTKSPKIRLNKMKYIDDHLDTLETKPKTVSHVINFGDNHESETTTLSIELASSAISESEINVKPVPSVKNQHMEEKQLLLESKKKKPEPFPDYRPNLQKIKSGGDHKEKYLSFTTSPLTVLGGKYVNNINIDSKNNLYRKLKNINSTSLNAAQKIPDSDIIIIPAQDNRNRYYNNENIELIKKLQKHLQNLSYNPIYFIYIENINIDSKNLNSYNDYGKVEQDNNKTNKQNEFHESAADDSTAQHVSKRNYESKWKNILSKIRSIINNEVIKKPKNAHSPPSDDTYFRNSDQSKDRVPISVDYYFERLNNEDRDYSDDVIDAVVDNSEPGNYDPPYTANVINFNQEAHSFSSSPNEVMLNVMRDMIRINSKLIVDYPWLKSVTNVRAGILKLFDLINKYVYNKKIHPLDLELLKYVLYLHKSASMKLKPINKRLQSDPKRIPVLNNLLQNVARFDGSMRQGLLDHIVEDQQVTILFSLQDFLNEVNFLLDTFHRKIEDVARLNPKNSQNLYDKLKDGYLKHAEDHDLRVVLLHVALARLFENIDRGAARVRKGFKSYVQQHPAEVRRDKREFLFILNILEELHWK